jgi:hypothetical protein
VRVFPAEPLILDASFWPPLLSCTHTLLDCRQRASPERGHFLRHFAEDSDTVPHKSCANSAIWARRTGTGFANQPFNFPLAKRARFPTSPDFTPIRGCPRNGHYGRCGTPILDIPAESYARGYFAPDRFLLRRLKQRTLPLIFIPLIPVTYFASLAFAIWMFRGPFDWRTRSMSKASLYEEQPAVSPDRIRWSGRGRPADDPLCRLDRKADAGHFSDTGSDRHACIWRGSYQFGSRGTDSVAAFPPRNVRAGRRHFSGPGNAGVLLICLRGLSVPPNERHAWLPIFLTSSLTVPPTLFVVVLRLLTAAHFQWSNPVYQEIENRSLWHLGFWEWMRSL